MRSKKRTLHGIDAVRSLIKNEPIQNSKEGPE